MTRLPIFQSWKPEPLFFQNCLWFHHFAVIRWSFTFVCHKKRSFCTFLPIYHSLKGTSSTTSDHSFPPLWTKKRRGNDLGIHPPKDLLSPNYQRRRSLFRHWRSRVLICRLTRQRIFPRRWSALGRLAPCHDAGVRRAPCRPCAPPADSRRDCRLHATIRSGTVQHVRSPTADCCYAVRCVKVHEMCRKVILSTHKSCPYVFTLVSFILHGPSTYQSSILYLSKLMCLTHSPPFMIQTWIMSQILWLVEESWVDNVQTC